MIDKIKVLKVLEKLKPIYETLTVSGDDVVGICYNVHFALRFEKNIDNSDHEEFFKFYESYIEDQDLFWKGYDDFPKTSLKNQFAWHPQDIQSRLDWINDSINKLTK